ncbi:hypothetical protein BJX63DRAFT_260141 [Aspergillus granulosus]|uniref:Zn(2)-C6 fungal-type domain-containing protein n=1 Tax=Aspergillus granulosus TaxID=176169 RepID=A0ABR4HA88_9EURO
MLESPQSMEIDPRLHAGRENSSSDTAESVTDYPEPSSQSARRQQPSSTTAPNPYETQTSLHTSSHLDSADPNDPYSDLKRPRACEACRQLKVRCEPDLNNPEEPCKRCAKAGRSCIVTQPTRKRQKKTDSRVAELERKIDALTATLQTSKQINALLPSNSNAQPAPSRDDHVGRRWLVSGQNASNRSLPAPTGQGSKRHLSGEFKDSRDTASLSTPSQASNPSPAAEPTHDAGTGKWRLSISPSTPGSSSRGTKAGPDIIERGLVSHALALDSFTRYVDHMAGHIPLVVFAPGTQMNDIRRDRPILFHAIIAVSIGRFEPSAQTPLLQELYKTIAERVIVKGEKSLDLVQALLVSCMFYTPPENFEEIKFYQLAQLAVSVGMDIGMNRKSSIKHKPFNLLREVVKNSPAADPDSPESRRTWLGCYFISVQTSSALRRPVLVRWLPYMDECVDILENSPDALPSDKWVIHWAKLARIIEEISARFFIDDLGAQSFYEPHSQFTLKAFERQLEQWKTEAFHSHNTALMNQAEAIVNVYLHEHSMALESPDEYGKETEVSIGSPHMTARISALSSTLSSIHRSIDAICSVPVRELINVPTVSLARTAFAIVALIKLYSIVTVPGSYIGQVIEPKDLKVDSYLDKVIAHYTAAGNMSGGVTPAKFSTVLSMLRDWFKSRKDQNGVLKDTLDASDKVEMASVLRAAANKHKQMTTDAATPTPLHILSEVATDDPNNQSSAPVTQQQLYPLSRPGFPQDPNIPQQPQSADVIQTLPPCIGIDPSSCPPPTATNTTATASGPNSTSDSWSPYASQRQFYTTSPFGTAASPNPNQPAPTAASTATSGYPNLTGGTGSAGMMMPSTPGVFAPEFGIQVNYTDPNLYAFYEWLGDGVSNFPVPPEGSGFF